jgi:hypothetical protein
MRLHQKAPRATLSPEFKNAVYDDPRGVCRLAPLAGFPMYVRLSALLNARRVARTPLNNERLLKLAEVMGFTGQVFRD